MQKLAMAAVASWVAIGGPGTAMPDQEVVVLDGRCTAESRIAKGPLDADLSALRGSFACDSAVISRPANQPGRILVQFTEKRRSGARVIGFAGFEGKDELVLVDGVYLEVGKRVSPVEGVCRIAQKGGQTDWIMCGARIESDREAIAPVIAFETRR